MYTIPTCDSALPSIERDPMFHSALRGLLDHPRTLPPYLFYDARGAQLFEAITRLDEYYLTRTEREILSKYAGEIAAVMGRGGIVMEYGSGAAEKIRLLVDDLAPQMYVPIDVSHEQLRDVAVQFASDYPRITVRPVIADFTAPFALPTDIPQSNRIALFLGSTIGNFHPHEARNFLQRVSQQIHRGGMVLLGVDLRKAPDILHAAYNDREGVTAAFNRNILEHIRREFGVRVNPNAFAHYAFFNPIAGRIEMHLIASEKTEIGLSGQRIHFAPGEGIWTESSYKYTKTELDQLVRKSGLETVQTWTDSQEWFAVTALRRP